MNEWKERTIKKVGLVFVIVLMGIVCVVIPHSQAKAQSSFTIKSGANDHYVHSESGFLELIASKAYLKLQGTFNPNTSGSCPFPYQASCNGLRVVFDGALAKMVSVTNPEIVLITPNISSDSSNGLILIQRETSPGFFGDATHTESSMEFRRNSPMPFSVYNSGDNQSYFSGDLYGFNSNCIGANWLNSLSTSAQTGGLSGKHTFLQLYFTGIHSDDWDDTDFLDVAFFGPSTENEAVSYNKPFDAMYSEGVYVVNVYRDNSQPCLSGAWSSGDHFFNISENLSESSPQGISIKLVF